LKVIISKKGTFEKLHFQGLNFHEFKSRVLHDEAVAATWSSGNISMFAWWQRRNRKNMSRYSV
jgi:hypothetical protein